MAGVNPQHLNAAIAYMKNHLGLSEAQIRNAMRQGGLETTRFLAEIGAGIEPDHIRHGGFDQEWRFGEDAWIGDAFANNVFNPNQEFRGNLFPGPNAAQGQIGAAAHQAQGQKMNAAAAAQAAMWNALGKHPNLLGRALFGGPTNPMDYLTNWFFGGGPAGIYQKTENAITDQLHRNAAAMWRNKVGAFEEYKFNEMMKFRRELLAGTLGGQEKLYSALPQIAGALGQGLQGLNIFNPAGKQAIEDVKGNTLVSHGIDPKMVSPDALQVVNPVRRGRLRGLLADVINRGTDQHEMDFGTKARGAGRKTYSDAVNKRASAMTDSLQADAAARKADAANKRAHSANVTNKAIADSRNAAALANLSLSNTGNLMNQMGSVFGNLFG
jgi:hypothetical protein